MNSCSTDPMWTVPTNTWGGLTYQYAYDGNAYIALYFRNLAGSNGRNYIEVKLKDSLVANNCYYVEFYVSLTDAMRGGCNNISMALSKSQLLQSSNPVPGVIPFNAQIYNYGNPIIKDTQNWVKIRSIYVAQGGEQYITIGNFKNDANTLYDTIPGNSANYGGAAYYVDDVQIIPLSIEPYYANAYAGDDITITAGDSVFVGSLINGVTNMRGITALGKK